MNEAWHPLWEKSLHLGWRLLKAGSQTDPTWSKEAFQQEIEVLREEVKAHLFRERPVLQPSAEGSESQEDKAIYDILMRVLRKWRAEREPEEPPIENELQETLVLSQRRAPIRSEEEPLRSSFQSMEAKGDIPETVIIPSAKTFSTISGEDASKEPKQSRVKQQPSQEEFLAETVILGPKIVPGRGKDESK